MENWITIELPMCKKQIKWKPYNTKDVREYLYVLGDNKTDKKIVDGTIQVLRNNVHEDSHRLFDSLGATDLTYLFINMKARSYSNVMEFDVNCKCTFTYPTSFNIISDMKIRIDEYEPVLLESNGHKVIFKEPVFVELLNSLRNDDGSNNQKTLEEIMFLSFVEVLNNKDEVVVSNIKQFDEYLNTITPKEYASLIDYLEKKDNYTKLEKEVTCPVCGNKETVSIDSLDFFVIA